jgi:hypothetical protein
VRDIQAEASIGNYETFLSSLPTVNPPIKFRRRQEKPLVGNHLQRDLVPRNIDAGASTRRAAVEKI